ncbi:hypothetical protein EDD18DRAFT_1363444 [Armillaria luteobubalina]|uniref:Uncharacterized protein n=1 Tax=Armillaria luteobubalina TaxID=153913 RepID=A0AA39PBZ9_9AGAR|nr:hypothetical protein EDD18DRAFT_1363444 [Armillaria luteobubalina]
MMEATGNIEFMAATGFGPDEQEYLAKNAIDFHRFDSGAFTAFRDIWLDTIWQQHVLYWPLEDCSDEGLKEHCKRVQYALRWCFDALDPGTGKQELAYAATHGAIVCPPGPPAIQQLTFQPTITHVP